MRIAQQARDPAAASAFLLESFGGAVVEERREVAITKAVDGELAVAAASILPRLPR